MVTLIKYPKDHSVFILNTKVKSKNEVSAILLKAIKKIELNQCEIIIKQTNN